mgnify:CR=1 FL=1
MSQLRVSIREYWPSELRSVILPLSTATPITVYMVIITHPEYNENFRTYIDHIILNIFWSWVKKLVVLIIEEASFLDLLYQYPWCTRLRVRADCLCG